MTQLTRITHHLLAAALLVCASTRLHAQLTLQQRTTPPPASVWPTARIVEGDRLVVVETIHPEKRQECKVKSIDDDELVCGKSHGHVVSFRKDDVAALISPVKNDRWPALLGGTALTGVGAAIFYGAILIASVSTPLIAVAVPVAFVGAMFGLTGPVAMIFAIHDPGTGEGVLYQRDGVALQVKLRS